MAKTKRRQMAALAAQAELKALAGNNERTSSGDKSGPSGTVPPLDEPMVEIRTQRIVFKIPALPSKPAADTPQTPDLVAKKEILGRRRRKKPRTDIDLSSEQVPADEAKISKVILQIGKWKRQKRMRDLLPSAVKDTTASTGLSNGDQRSSVAKPMASDEHANGELLLSIAKAPGSGSQLKPRVNLITGSRKRVKLQEVLVRSPAEKESKLSETQGKPKNTMEYSNHGAAGDLLLTDPNRSQDLPKVSNGGLPSTVAHSSPASQKRRRGNRRKSIPQVEPIPKRAAVLRQKTRTRAQISLNEAIAVAGFQEMQKEKIRTLERESLGKSAEEDTLLVRGSSDAEALNATGDQSQAEQDKSPFLISPLVREIQWLAVNSSSHELVQNGHYNALQSSQERDAQEDPNPYLQIEEYDNTPFAPGEEGVLLGAANEEIDLGQSDHWCGGNGTILRGAELIKQESQLATMKRRLEAAGGRKQWLLDKGLGQFVSLLDEQNIDHLSLLHLTMEGLKSMGLLPVGPRRKLIHAITCLTLPSTTSKAPFTNSRLR